MTGQPPTYEELIREVFLEPIRSVVVVDDKFPTLERLLDLAASMRDPSSAQDVDQSWEIDKAQGIVRFCHMRQPPWLVEFHDGQPPLEQDEAVIADHLSQSDLMILDYHLNPNDPEAGTAAIEILRRIAANDHFNLVLVYTKGATNAGGDIERVWQEIAVALSTAHDTLTCDPRALAAARELIEELEDQDAEIESKIRAAVDESAYLPVRAACASGSPDWNNLLEHEALARMNTELGRFPNLPLKKRRQVLRWALHERQEALRERLSGRDLGQLQLSFDSSKVNWIRTDRLFVTVVSKHEKPSQLPGMLCQALLRWRPAPYRLLMSKVRAVLAEAGVQAEDGVLKNRHLQKAWFNDLLTNGEEERRWKIHATVARQWEWLGDALATTAIDYANRLSTHLREDPVALKAEELYQGLDEAEVLKHRNSYVCSKPVSGHHLTTGHILEIGNGTNASEKWLCLSPACDLVPGQRTTGWYGRLKNHLPFLAVQLYPDETHCLGSANRGNHLFLMVGNEIACFSFTPPLQRTGETLNDDAAPKWEQMFAQEQGRCDGADFDLNVARIQADKGELAIRVTPARIIAQLRYEYALNLLHRLGATLSRVGLDFRALER